MERKKTGTSDSYKERGWEEKARNRENIGLRLFSNIRESSAQFFFFSFIFISWRLITSQHFRGFCQMRANKDRQVE